ncbi:MAG: hypothetical protein GY749_05415 [Desulfobacteraceae bacterium]|nr:hypothetical protein [Desulfobacteraceae bacterium]
MSGNNKSDKYKGTAYQVWLECDRNMSEATRRLNDNYNLNIARQTLIKWCDTGRSGRKPGKQDVIQTLRMKL